ncbi:SdiA-regulated domain-containing protein [Sulfurovum sp. XGS-02]|uniref:SdiA-regulated domain-containing protein n=1 Tax=Sulfurovum sp. XGS-02 TaxID=2925411 RepID=UPI0020688C34|nr:SdiA-regulated domain-containing protein [Sulfurovum sp. XGS-02]UPT76621.1 SdiA-regulated domain-containing protein [Sulfurovum sp. XGS-02]
MKYYFWLPFAFLVCACAAPKGKVIAHIPEASGISHCISDDTLVVANDEGTYYKISRKGKILQKMKLGKYDLEGVICEDREMIFAIENKGVLIVDTHTGEKKEIPLHTMYHGKKLSLFNKRSGVEAIAKVGDHVYLARQSKKKKKSFIAVVRLIPYPSKVVDVIEHRVADTAGLTYHEGYLYMVSDKEDLLIKYDLQKKNIVQKVKLGKGAWEGIAFDTNGNVYLADDDGRIVKYKKKQLGL